MKFPIAIALEVESALCDVVVMVDKESHIIGSEETQGQWRKPIIRCESGGGQVKANKAQVKRVRVRLNNCDVVLRLN